MGVIVSLGVPLHPVPGRRSEGQSVCGKQTMSRKPLGPFELSCRGFVRLRRERLCSWPLISKDEPLVKEIQLPGASPQVCPGLEGGCPGPSLAGVGNVPEAFFSRISVVSVRGSLSVTAPAAAGRCALLASDQPRLFLSGEVQTQGPERGWRRGGLLCGRKRLLQVPFSAHPRAFTLPLPAPTPRRELRCPVIDAPGRDSSPHHLCRGL